MVWCAVLCCAVLCCAVLCCAVLYCLTTITLHAVLLVANTVKSKQRSHSCKSTHCREKAAPNSALGCYCFRCPVVHLRQHACNIMRTVGQPKHCLDGNMGEMCDCTNVGICQ